jgi:SAM-dependent methyltransferase
MNNPEPSQSKSKSIWDDSQEQYQKGNFKVYWEMLSRVQQYQFKAMTGDENLHFFWHVLEEVRNRVGQKDLAALSLGCSEGDPGIEMRLIESGVFQKVVVMDLAQGLLEKQKAIAARRGLKGIHYLHEDLNRVSLTENEYDLIWAVGTIHHTENLERLFGQIQQALRENALFAMREYVGPNRLQFTARQLSIVNEILALLPEKYKRSHTGGIKNRMQSPALSDLLALDPSEAVRSRDIVPVLKEKLEVTKLVYTGGTILHPLLDSIASNFEGDEEADSILRLLILFEKTLIEGGALPSDYVFCLARKRRENPK